MWIFNLFFSALQLLLLIDLMSDLSLFFLVSMYLQNAKVSICLSQICYLMDRKGKKRLTGVIKCNTTPSVQSMYYQYQRKIHHEPQTGLKIVSKTTIKKAASRQWKQENWLYEQEIIEVHWLNGIYIHWESRSPLNCLLRTLHCY